MLTGPRSLDDLCHKTLLRPEKNRSGSLGRSTRSKRDVEQTASPGIGEGRTEGNLKTEGFGEEGIQDHGVKGRKLEDMSFEIGDRAEDPEETREMDITVEIGYTEDVEGVLSVVRKVVKGTDQIYERPKPELVLGDMGPNNISIHVKPVCNKEEYWTAMTALVKNLKLELFKEGLAYKAVKASS